MKNGDKIDTVTLASAGAAANAPYKPEGYPIIVSSVQGVGIENYTITYVPGKLTIKRLPLTIIAKDDSKVYGDEKVLSNYEVIGAFPNGNPIDSVTLASEGAPAAALYKAEGYPIVPSNAQGSGVENYVITYVNGTLQVSKRAITVKALDDEKDYGEAKTLDGAKGFYLVAGEYKNGNKIDSVTLTCEGVAEAAPYKAEGYPIVPSNAQGTGLENYEISYQNGTLTIKKIQLTITAKPRIKQYGESLEFIETEGFTYSGIKDEQHRVLTVKFACDGAEPNADYKEDGYPIKISNAEGVGLENYTINYIDGTLTILKRKLLISADDAIKAYGESLVCTNFTVSGELQNGDKVTSVTISSEKASDVAVEVGNYVDEIKPYHEVLGINTNNYDIAFSNGTLTVTQAILAVSVNDAKWRLGKPKPAYSFADFSSQLKAGDTMADVTGGTGLAADVVFTNAIWNTSTPMETDMGVYENEIWIDTESLDGLRASNYLITVEPGDLTIASAEAELETSVSAKLNWNTGLLDLTLEITNVGDGEVDPEFSYWAQLKKGEGNSDVEFTYYIASPSGIMTNGCDYVELTSEVKSALRVSGNGDEIFDPGETITVRGVSVYHWKRWNPEKFIDSNEFFVAGILADEVDRKIDSVINDKEIADAEVEQDKSMTTSSEVQNGNFIDESNITDPYSAEKSMKLYGALYDGCNVAGVVELKLGKVNKRNGTSKLSGAVTAVNGKKYSIKSKVISGVNGLDPIAVTLEVKGIGDMSILVGGTSFVGKLNSYHVQSADVGGDWSRASAIVKVNAVDTSMFAGEVITELLPLAEEITVDRGKWKVSKAAPIKYKKVTDKATGEYAYKLEGYDDPKKPNLSAMKLSYSSKNGTFKGTFKVYAIENNKLKKYTVKVSGVVVDGVGYGVATSKKPLVDWSLIVE